jgi:hypothetical protein
MKIRHKSACMLVSLCVYFSISFVLIVIMHSCTGNYTPKPKGFLRIEPPMAQYTIFNEKELPYSFSVSRQAIIELPPTDSAAYWINIDYPLLNAKIYCNYRQISSGILNELTEESYRLAERAAGNASVITGKSFENKEITVYGTLFFIEGESPSPVQFMITDSSRHFFRGALYYNHQTNTDSIAPVTDYIKRDITELIQSFYWKK